MVTWTFDVVTLIVGIIVGMFVGTALMLIAELHDGGAWSKGFSDGFQAEKFVEEMKQQKEASK